MDKDKKILQKNNIKEINELEPKHKKQPMANSKIKKQQQKELGTAKGKTPKFPKKKPSLLQQQYKHEIDRLTKHIRTAEKKGYIFDDEVIPIMPKRVTKKSLAKIKATKPSELYQHSQYVDFETGEIIPGEEARKIEKDLINRNRGAKKVLKQERVKIEEEFLENDFPFFTDIVIQNFKDDVNHFPNQAGPMLTSWIDQLIQNEGAEDVAQMLEDAKSEGYWIDYTIAYNKDMLIKLIGVMMNYLPDASMLFKEKLLDQFEFSEDWTSPD